MEKVRLIYGFLSFLFLIAGICVYLFFRDLSGILFFAKMPISEFALNEIIQLTPSLFSNVLKYNLAGMFWLVSGILFFRFIWLYRAKEQKVYIGCFIGLAAVLEISQLSGKVPGTFDPADLLFMGIGAFGEGLIYNIFVRRRIA